MSLLALCRTYVGYVYRAHNPLWQYQPESGAGAALRGGRWNAIGVPALYTSERFETAWLEAQQGFPFKTQPLTICSYEVNCGPILDLCDPANRRAVHPGPDDWLQEPWLARREAGQPVIAWQIAAKLVAVGCMGVRVPSQAAGATEDDINVVFWRWTTTPPTMVRVIDDENRLRLRK